MTWGTKFDLEKKLEFLGYLTLKPHDPAIVSFWSIPACDRQPDKQIDKQTRRQGISLLAMLCVADARQKNKYKFDRRPLTLPHISHEKLICQLEYLNVDFMYIQACKFIYILHTYDERS